MRLAFRGATLNSNGAPTDTTLFTDFRAFFEILLRLQALRNLPLPTGLGTQTVLLRGRWPSPCSSISLTSWRSHAIMTSFGLDNSRIIGASSLAWAGWSITQPVDINRRQ